MIASMDMNAVDNGHVPVYLNLGPCRPRIGIFNAEMTSKALKATTLAVQLMSVWLCPPAAVAGLVASVLVGQMVDPRIAQIYQAVEEAKAETLFFGGSLLLAYYIYPLAMALSFCTAINMARGIDKLDHPSPHLSS